ncbi:MAG: sugar phosphate nucleotidyltransferase [Muribaculaceae bacterium]
MEIQKHIIEHTRPLHEALGALNALSGTGTMTLFVTGGRRLLGSLTDGDVRRALLAGIGLDAPVRDAMHIPARAVPAPAASPDNVLHYKMLRQKGITIVPVVDNDGNIVDMVDLRATRTRLPLSAILMAGGKGERLRPMTLTTPKPLLKIEGKAIIDYNIEALAECGVSDITVTTRYLAEQIHEHFRLPVAGVQVKCITEDKPLGTIGSAALVRVEGDGNTLVMNSDLLTTVSFEEMYLRHIREDADITVAVIPYQVSVPFAIITTDGPQITGIEEKPAYSYFANAGIYIFANRLLRSLPTDRRTDATDLIADTIAAGGKVVYSPVNGTWLDVGSPADFEQASQLMRHYNNLRGNDM